jgi:hypothetical protein
MSKKPSTSLTSLAASEDSALDLNEPDLFGQLPSVSENPSRKQSSESIGPTSPSTTTSEPSTQIDLEELISSAVGSPVSRGPLPGSSEAQRMTEISGRSWLPLLKGYGLGGSLGKMCEALLTNRWASSAAFLTWKASDIKPSHLLFQLAPSMPRTDEIGSGLWATPMSSNRGGRSKASIEKGGGITLQQQVKLWPTPRSCSAMAAENIQNRVNDKFPNLESVVARTMWPTPTTRDHKGGRKPETLAESGRGETNSLNDAVTVRDQHGSLNPTWVEWLMGFPTGWTDLKPSEMPSSRKSLNKSEKQSSQEKTDEM